MEALALITHALMQGQGPACLRPGMGVEAAPAPVALAPVTQTAPAPARGVSMVKAGDAPAPALVLAWDTGLGLRPVAHDLSKEHVCDWCPEAATRQVQAWEHGPRELACMRHALIFGAFVPVSALAPGW